MGNLFYQIRNTVRQIPKGKVTTYGVIARAVGMADARKIGWAVYGNKDPKIPCHRVVFKDGSVAENYSVKGWQEQKRKLLAEGIAFVSEKKVDLEKHFWELKTKALLLR